MKDPDLSRVEQTDTPVVIAPSTDAASVIHNEHQALRRCWHPVALSAEVADQPVGIELLGERWVLVRIDGTLVAFVDSCPHRGVPLSAGTVDDSLLRCAYHGWAFDTAGQLADIPASRRRGSVPACTLTRPAELTERYGLVWLAPEPPIAPMVEVPEWDADGFTCRQLEPRHSTGGAAAITDNFLDVGHFPFLHSETFGISDELEVPPLHTDRDGWTVSFDLRAPYTNPDGSIEESHQIYECTAPFALRLRMHFPESDRTHTITFFCQPESRHSVRLYKGIAVTDIADDDHEAVAAFSKFELLVTDEDIAMIEQISSDELRLEPNAQMHGPADRGAVAWRRVLIELMAQTGEPA